MLKGREHEDEDDALKLITGTGKPVLILCPKQMDKDVSKRGQNWLAFWRQNYLAVTKNYFPLYFSGYYNSDHTSRNLNRALCVIDNFFMNDA